MGTCATCPSPVFNNSLLEVSRFLSSASIYNDSQYLTTYNGLSQIDILLQDVVYRLFTQNYEDYSKIIQICEILLNSNNKYFCNLIKSICLIFTQKTTQAEKILKELISSHQTYSHSFYHLAFIHILRDDWRSAIQQLEICLNIDPSNNEAFVLKEYLSIQWNDPFYEDYIIHKQNVLQKEQQVIHKIKEISIKDQRCFQSFSIIASQLNNVSLSLCNEYLKIFPYCYPAFVIKGNLAIKHNAILAFSNLEVALNLCPFSTIILSNLALAAFAKKDFSQVLEIFERSNQIIGQLTKQEMKCQVTLLKTKILTLNQMGRQHESIQLCNDIIKKQKYPIDFLSLKMKLLNEKQDQQIICCTLAQINQAKDLSSSLKLVQLKLVAFHLKLSQYMLINPKLVFIDLQLF